MSDTPCPRPDRHEPHPWGHLEWCPGDDHSSEEIRRCDGCGEDYNAFAESHIGHETPLTDDTPWVARIKAEALQEAADVLLAAADYRGSGSHQVSLPVARRSIALWLKARGAQIQREAAR